MIPELVNISRSPWDVLPQGIHVASLAEIDAKYSTTSHRKWLFEGFCRAVSNLQQAGCLLVYLDGSFVTAKNHPDDFDAVWDPAGVDPYKLDPVLLNFDNKRAAQKAKYGGELFISTHQAMHGVSYIDFFQNDRYSSQKKGILSVQI